MTATRSSFDDVNEEEEERDSPYSSYPLSSSAFSSSSLLYLPPPLSLLKLLPFPAPPLLLLLFLLLVTVMKKATFPLRFGPSLERLRNPFERATFVITNFPLCLLLLNLLKEVSFDEEEGTEEERDTSTNFRIISLYYPKCTKERRGKSFPKKTLSLSLSLRETERRWYAQQRRERQQNSLSLVLSSSSSSSSEENNLLIASVSAREGERCNFFARRQKKL